MKYIPSVLVILLLVSCTTNVQDQGLLGTWIYTVEDAPFGFQTGRAIFYQENDSTKARLKVYGIPIETADLEMDSSRVSFTTEIEHEQIFINLEMKGDELLGMVHYSEGAMSISMVKKSLRNREGRAQRPDRTRKRRKTAIATGRVLLEQFPDHEVNTAGLNYKVHTFYYGWYGNPEFDGEYSHWNHQVIPHWIDSTWNHAGSYPGGVDIGANFYPRLGCYSSGDPEVIRTHLQQIKEAGIGVVALSWWGKGHATDQSVNHMLDEAKEQGLKVAIHIEPIYNTADEFREQLQYLSSSYFTHPAIYRLAGKPLFYLFNSSKLKYKEWQSLLDPHSPSTLRDTPLDGVFIGLWTTAYDGEFSVNSGFDGVYTYFASDGFAYGSTTSNWAHMAEFARENNLIFIPSVGPGYVDTRIRPWNEKTTRNRDHGRYYEEMFGKAVHASPDFISITSFNEWHEGSQIEPAIPMKTPSFTYLDYGEDTDPLYYIQKTKSLIDTYDSYKLKPRKNENN